MCDFEVVVFYFLNHSRHPNHVSEICKFSGLFLREVKCRRFNVEVVCVCVCVCVFVRPPATFRIKRHEDTKWKFRSERFVSDFSSRCR